jgi:GntR family transcriptional regulator
VQLFVTPSDETPIYRQIMRQFREAIALGGLKPGDKLPSHRELAEQLVVAPLTVKKAYDELETGGYLETLRGRGTFVAASLPDAGTAAGDRQLQSLARDLLSRAYLSGLTREQTLELVRQVDRHLKLEHGQCPLTMQHSK